MTKFRIIIKPAGNIANMFAVTLYRNDESVLTTHDTKKEAETFARGLSRLFKCGIEKESLPT